MVGRRAGGTAGARRIHTAPAATSEVQLTYSYIIAARVSFFVEVRPRRVATVSIALLLRRSLLTEFAAQVAHYPSRQVG